jgi:hypothetical protein
MARVEWQRVRGVTDRPAVGVSAWTHQQVAYVVATLFVCSLAAWHATMSHPPVFPVDDAYITLHNAEVLYDAVDPNYTGTPALVGSTSPIHV